MRLYAIEVDPDEAEVVSDRCWQAGAAGIWEQEASGRTVLRVGVEDEAAAAFVDALTEHRPRDVTDTEVFELVTRTVSVGPVHDPVTLEVPGTVFGDGLHPTTATCLDVLARLVAPGARVLDVGCGSGALSVVAARAGASVTAIDVDPVAVAATRRNAAANGVAVDASIAPLSAIPGAFDVVVANISAQAVLELAGDLWRVLAPGGALVPSGILAGRWHEVRAALGGTAQEVHDVRGWVTAVVTR
ncbi:MAG TPA: 50S ribosomal protein L11 methyltransferase [Acidimicrobiales bacterium]|nr:50S ribosomal protein L11 methyltransferase [Acidimicrobiales bacterium]